MSVVLGCAGIYLAWRFIRSRRRKATAEHRANVVQRQPLTEFTPRYATYRGVRKRSARHGRKWGY